MGLRSGATKLRQHFTRGNAGPWFPAVPSVGRLKAGCWDADDRLPCVTSLRRNIKGLGFWVVPLLPPLLIRHLCLPEGQWEVGHVFTFVSLDVGPGEPSPLSFSISFCSKPGSGLQVHVEVSNERHRERGRTAGSLEGSTPKAETTEELTVRNNCGGSRKKRESRPDGQRAANPQRSPGMKTRTWEETRTSGRW